MNKMRHSGNFLPYCMFKKILSLQLTLHRFCNSKSCVQNTHDIGHSDRSLLPKQLFPGKMNRKCPFFARDQRLRQFFLHQLVLFPHLPSLGQGIYITIRYDFLLSYFIITKFCFKICNVNILNPVSFNVLKVCEYTGV